MQSVRSNFLSAILFFMLSIGCTSKHDDYRSAQNSNTQSAGVSDDSLFEKNISPDTPKPTENQLLSKMISHYFESNPSCAFQVDTQKGGIRINDVMYYSYATGPSQLAVGYHLDCEEIVGISDIFAWVINKNIPSDRKFNSFSSIAKEFSGVTPFNSDRDFWHIRPEFIEWAMQNLIPEPDGTVFGVTCKQIYDKLISAIFRNLYQSLLWLECSDGRIKHEYEEYRKKYEENTTDDPYFGAIYLQQKYRYVKFLDVPDYLFNEPEAIGFWLRRYWDGSYNIVKQTMLTLLEKYDSALLDEPFIKEHVSRIDGEDSTVSVKWLRLTFPDITLELPHFQYTCEYDTAKWLSNDTVFLDMSAFGNCQAGKFDTIHIFKNKNVKDLRISQKGAKAFFFSEEGKGGMSTDEKVSNIWSEEINLELSGMDIFIRKNIFNSSKAKWGYFSRHDTLMVDSIKSAMQYYSDVLPVYELITITWKNSNTDGRCRKVFRLEYGYGD